MPPATTTSALPASKVSCANMVVCMAEPHIFDRVTAPVESGKPALRKAWRAGAWPWPAIRQLPKNTCSTASGATPDRSTAARMATAPRSLAVTLAKSPWKAPMGVRAAPTITTGSFMLDLRLVVGRCLLTKTQVLRIREDVLDMAVFDALLARLPILRRQQVGMVLHEILADAGIAQQEGAELFGKHIVLTDGIPRFGRHFFLLRAGLRDDAELAIGDVLDFIVIVKNDTLMTGHAKVFIQHVARKNIRSHQLLDGVAVLDDGVFHQVSAAFLFGIAQPHVQRYHAPLDVQVADDDLLLVFLDQRGSELFQLGQQFRRKAGAGKGHVGILERVGHAAYAVVVFHQQILLLDLRARGFLGRWEKILDHLEDIRKRRQGKHQHHQAADAGRAFKVVR